MPKGKATLSCAGLWTLKSIKTFLDLPDTNHECSGRWDEENQDSLKKIYIRNYLFEGSCKVKAKSNEAYHFLTEGENCGPISCQGIFADWEGGDFQVIFWMKEVKGEDE